MKSKLLISVLTLVLVVGGFIYYYSLPLTAKSVFPYLDQANKVYTELYKDGKGEVKSHDVERMDISELLRIFNSTSYTKSLGSSNIRNDGQLMMMTLFYLDGNGNWDSYDIDINDQGYIVIDHKKYKMNLAKDVFDQVKQWFFKV